MGTNPAHLLLDTNDFWQQPAVRKLFSLSEVMLSGSTVSEHNLIKDILHLNLVSVRFTPTCSLSTHAEHSSTCSDTAFWRNVIQIFPAWP